MTAATRARTGASLEELQAALAAAQRGEFATNRGSATRTAAQPALATAAPPAQLDGTGWRPDGWIVAVLAAHSGAGASTVALAVAEALQDTTAAVRLVELADPSRSGLAGASDAELGEHGGGWRRGRRGRLVIDRLIEPVHVLEHVPPPAAGPDDAEALVLDVGWPARQAFTAAGWLSSTLAAVPLLLVCRPTVPGIRQSEYLLAELEPRGSAPVSLAALGPARWPGAAAASAGPHIRAARASGRVVSVPLDRRIEIDGISAAALPKPLAAAGRAVLAILPATTAAAAANHRADQPASGRAD